MGGVKSVWKEIGISPGEGTGTSKRKPKKVKLNLPTVEDEAKMRVPGKKVCPGCGGRGFTREGYEKRGRKRTVPCKCRPKWT
jgi:hypothetical protein